MILPRFVHLLVVSIFLGVCEAGLTSSYVRETGIATDMPLDSDVFRVPRGYNAPQQVTHSNRAFL